MSITRVLVCLLLSLVLASCEGGHVMKNGNSQEIDHGVTAAQLQKVLGMRLFFGHQSVGYNIIEGIRDVFKEKGIEGLAIVETRALPADTKPGCTTQLSGQTETRWGKSQISRPSCEAVSPVMSTSPS